MRVVLLILGMLIPTLGFSQAYKCVEGGKTTYQDAPCAGVPSRAVDTSDSASGVTGMKKDADRMAVKEKQAAAQAARAPKAKPPKRDRQWYRENCKARKIGGLTASYDC